MVPKPSAGRARGGQLLWTRRRDGSARPAGADRPPERPPDDVHHLVDVGLGLSPLGGRPDTAGDVVLEHEDGERIDRGTQRGRLLEDVDAVLLPLDHPADPAGLTLDP